MGQAISDNILYNKTVNGIDFDEKTVYTVQGDKYQADTIVTTIPWMEFRNINGIPEGIKCLINYLKYSSIQIQYCPNNLDTEAQWIYYPDPKLEYHRVLVRHNFCSNSRGYWTETNGNRVKKSNNNNYKYFNRYAYPLNLMNKPEVMKILLDFSSKKNVIGLGRWGEHQHYNSDVTVDLALNLAEKLLER